MKFTVESRSIDSFCEDRSSAYEIQSELIVRKFLEQGTSYKFEFRKNDDKYGVDLVCLVYDIQGSEWNRREVGSVEVELSTTWHDEYPKHWKTYSFLARKLFEYDARSKQFDFSKPKICCNDMVYVISNKSLTDWIAIDASMIMENKHLWIPDRSHVTGSSRHDWFIRFPLHASCVARGQSEVLALVKNVFNGR